LIYLANPVHPVDKIEAWMKLIGGKHLYPTLNDRIEIAPSVTFLAKKAMVLPFFRKLLCRVAWKILLGEIGA
jgi:hypothetical protein